MTDFAELKEKSITERKNTKLLYDLMTGKLGLNQTEIPTPDKDELPQFYDMYNKILGTGLKTTWFD